MTTALAEDTVLPPEKPREQARVIALRDKLRTGTGTAKLVDPDGTEIELPTDLYRVLRNVADALAQGLAVTVAPHHTVLTTQEAADILGVTRPTLVKLLDEGAIPSQRPGRHRRVMLRDLLAYVEQRRVRRSEVLDRMVAEGEDDGLYDLPADPGPVR